MASGQGNQQRSNPSTKAWHYTDHQGFEGIMNTGKIKASTDTGLDAMLGQGTYLTTMHPFQSSTKIARNNWDDGPYNAESLVDQGRTDYAVELRVPNHDLVKNHGSRNVLMKPGDIHLEDYPHKIYYRGDGRCTRLK